MNLTKRGGVIFSRQILCSAFLLLAVTLLSAGNVMGRGAPDSFADLADKLGPTVVNVYSTQIIDAKNLPYNYFFKDGDLPDLFNYLFQGPRHRQYRKLPEQRRTSLGSGVIISADGYIVTNNHVVEDADKINVKLANAEEYEATIVGRDKPTDLALIKIEPKHKLTPAHFGNAADLRVGDWVMAIGNPFGFERTVTAGIVSGKGRSLGDGPYQNFIQTDASINPGNSGGPLFNMEGKLMGINTAIYSRSGGNIGLGFAIPVDMVENVVQQLKGTGKVTRGMLGVMIQPITRDLAEQFGLDRPVGALVGQVIADSPAEKAGIRPGDIILTYQGREISKMSILPSLVAETPVGTEAEVTIFRDGREKILTVNIGALDEVEEGGAIGGGHYQHEELGLTLRDLNEKLAESLGLLDSSGVLVADVVPGSSAYRAGLRKGDVILEAGIGRKRDKVDSVRDLNRLFKKARKHQKNILLLIRSDNQIKFVVLPIGG